MKQIEPIIKFEHFNFSYAGSDFQELSDLNLNIHTGEFVLLTGKSGCGKTTFTRCLNGLIPDFYEGNDTIPLLYDRQISAIIALVYFCKFMRKRA